MLLLTLGLNNRGSLMCFKKVNFFFLLDGVATVHGALSIADCTTDRSAYIELRGTLHERRKVV